MNGPNELINALIAGANALHRENEQLRAALAEATKPPEPVEEKPDGA